MTKPFRVNKSSVTQPHPVWARQRHLSRPWISNILEEIHDSVAVGEASEGLEAVKLIKRLNPYRALLIWKASQAGPVSSRKD